MRTSVQKQVGGYDRRLPHTGDLEMWMRLAAHSDVGYIRGVDQAFYRMHDQNMTKSTARCWWICASGNWPSMCCWRTAPTSCRTPIALSAMVHRKLSHEALFRAAAPMTEVVLVKSR